MYNEFNFRPHNYELLLIIILDYLSIDSVVAQPLHGEEKIDIESE